MTGDDFAERLAARGLDDSARDAAAATFARALAAFNHRIAGPPAFAWWVPGRLEVFGKHTDYAGGRSLVAALPRGFAVLAAPRSDDVVRVIEGATGEEALFGSRIEETAGWRRYVAVVIERLTRNFPGARRGADIVFTSNLPVAAGMSSSSALVVGIATALVRLWALEERPEWQQNLPDLAARAVYYSAFENGATFGTLAGDDGVGTQSGSEDHAAMLLAKPEHVSAFAYLPLRAVGSASVPRAWRFVVCTSGVTAEKTGRAQELYNRASAGAAALLRIWNARVGPATSLGAALSESDDAESRLERLIAQHPVPGWSADLLRRRLRHFCREDARIPDALAAFTRAEANRLGELAAGSQRDAEQLLGNQVPETIALVDAALACGAFAAVSFGAGFGGGAWALTTVEHAPALVRDWPRAYDRGGSGVVAFIATPGPALIELVTPPSAASTGAYGKSPWPAHRQP